MNHVLLFVRAPRYGEVKTRLAAEIGPRAALEVYRRLGSRVVRQIRAGASITVWCAPADGIDEAREWLGELPYRAQPEGDLGARMTFAFEAHFAERPAEPAIAVGADAPGIDADVIAAAGAALRTADVVIGPARDGGYYLIGLARRLPEVFEGIPWGTGRVFQATCAACRRLGIAPVVLGELRDVDRLDDLKALGIRAS